MQLGWWVGSRKSCRWHLGIAILRSHVIAWQCQRLFWLEGVGWVEGSCNAEDIPAEEGAGRKLSSSFAGIPQVFPESPLNTRFGVGVTPQPQTHTQVD